LLLELDSLEKTIDEGLEIGEVRGFKTLLNKPIEQLQRGRERERMGSDEQRIRRGGGLGDLVLDVDEMFGLSNGIYPSLFE
jgi:hypothetical protein